MNKDLSTIKKWNFGAGIVHSIAALLTIVVLVPEKKHERTITLDRITYDVTRLDETSKVDLPAKLVEQSKIDLKGLVVWFFIVTAASHFLYASDFFGRGYYTKAILGIGWNPFRWIEYSISASVMIYLISVVSGTKDQVSALSAALITPGLMISGFTNERALEQNNLSKWSNNVLRNPKEIQPVVDSEIIWSNLIPAWSLYFVHWYIILSNYSKLSKEAKDAGHPVDPAVSFMVYSQLIFFSMFGIIQTYQIWRWLTARPGRIEPNYIIYEKAYIILSAVTKLFLASTVVYAIS